ncbi:MAG: PilZ domain-containing protein [Candidatus Omnitrophica bacterium]|nr:PilZ domain-containing protein [Candidatus Omnitrophota bacterium]
MGYEGIERRRYPRISNARFMVSYRILKEEDNVDITQSKNISLGGMLLTTNREFSSDTYLVLEIRLPFDPEPIKIVGRVVNSKKIVKDLIYETRIEFISIDEKHRNILSQTVNFYSKKKG